MITIDDVRQAQQRLRGYIRVTPMIVADNFRDGLNVDAELSLKLELLQATGSFKARGATNKLFSLPPGALRNGIVAASGGNHGLGTARAGQMAGVPTTIFLPTNASPQKIEKLKMWGAETIVSGASFTEASAAAREHVSRTGAVFFHPFADPEVVAGQGTLGLEILEQLPEVDTILVAMGGGGLISGVSVALKAVAPHVRIIGIEAAGSPVLLRGLEAGHNVELEALTTSVATMACAKTDDRIFDIVKASVDEIVLVDDDEMRSAAKWLWFEMGLAADLSGAAALAALRQGRFIIRSGEKICAIVCGAGPDAIIA